MSNDYSSLSTASQALSQSTADLLTDSNITNTDLTRFNTSVTQSKDALKALEPVPADSAKKANAAMDAADKTWQGEKLRAALVKAATPYPDFWLPLTDSLEMEEGFGQVSFSRSTTATYIDKSGVLQTAQANEPRFEKEGILIEGSSVNLVSNSAVTGWSPDVDAVTQTDGEGFGGFKSFILTNDGSGLLGRAYKNYSSSTLKKGDTITASVWVKNTGGTNTLFWLYHGKSGSSGDSVSTQITIPSKNKEWTRYSISQTVETDNTTYQIQIRNREKYKVEVACPQVEALPFATSYIPTEGTPVTRAAEQLSISPLNNVNSQSAAKTLFFDQHSYGYYSQPGVLIRIFSQAKPYRIFRKNENELLAGFIAAIDTTVEYKTGKLVTVFSDDSKLKVYQDGSLSSTTASVPLPDELIESFTTDPQYPWWGHIRNIRVWHRALTDDQVALL